MEFGTLLRIARQRSGKSAKQLEADAVLPHGKLSRWENARATSAYPRGDEVERLKRALGLSPEWERALELAAILDVLTRYGYANGTRDQILRNAYECAQSLGEHGAYDTAAEPYLILLKHHLKHFPERLSLRWEVINALGITLGILGEFHAAVTEHREARQLAKDLDRVRGIESTGHLGMALRNSGDTWGAFQYLTVVADYWRENANSELGVVSLIDAVRNQATPLKRAGTREQLFGYLRESQSVAERSGQVMQLRLTLQELARCHALQGDFDGTRRAYEALDSCVPSIPYPLHDMIVSVHRLAAEVSTGDIDDPLPFIRQWTPVCEQHGWGALKHKLNQLASARNEHELLKTARTLL